MMGVVVGVNELMFWSSVEKVVCPSPLGAAPPRLPFFTTSFARPASFSSYTKVKSILVSIEILKS